MCSSEAKQQSKEGGVVIHRHCGKRRRRGGRTTIKRVGEEKRLSFPENRSRIPAPRPHAQVNEGNREKYVRVKRGKLRGNKWSGEDWICGGIRAIVV